MKIFLNSIKKQGRKPIICLQGLKLFAEGEKLLKLSEENKEKNRMLINKG